MPKMTCVKCQTDLIPDINGALLFEYAHYGLYQVWSCDVWKCPDCGVEIVGGFGAHPIMEHWQEGFEERIAKIESNPASYIVRSYEKNNPDRGQNPIGYLGRK